MERIFGSVNADLLQQMDAACSLHGVSRSKLIQIAIETYLQNGNSTEKLQQLQNELQTTREDMKAMQNDLQTAKNDLQTAQNELQTTMQRYEDTNKIKDHQIAFLEGHISQLTQSLSQLALTGPKNEPDEPEYTATKAPLWKRLKFWAWV